MAMLDSLATELIGDVTRVVLVGRFVSVALLNAIHLKTLMGFPGK